MSISPENPVHVGGYEGLLPVGVHAAVDLHTQTPFSDGMHDTVRDFMNEAYGNVYLLGISDHANIGREEKEYRSSFYAEVLEEERGFSDPDVYKQRYYSIDEWIDDRDRVEWWSDTNPLKVLSDLNIIQDYNNLDDPDAFLNYEMVVMNGVELDYNPAIIEAGTREEERQIAEEYTDWTVEFLQDAHERGVGFDYVNSAVHDVHTPDSAYVKKDRLFKDFNHDEKLQFWEQYRKKQFYQMDSLAPRLQELGIPVIGVHPALIERNRVLVEAAEKALEDNTWVTEQGWITSMEDFWRPVAEQAKNATNFVFGANGKHSERYIYQKEDLKVFDSVIKTVENGGDAVFYDEEGRFMGVRPENDIPVLWEMLDYYLPGSDSHRPGEQLRRGLMTGSLDLPGEVRTPVDMWVEEELLGVQETETAVEDDRVQSLF